MLPVGYSDHSLGINIAIAAVARGAIMLEKHFTLDKNLPGPDHKASLDPREFARMVTAIREVEVALGNAEKKLPRQSLIILILCASIWLRLKRSRKVKNSPSAILQLSVRKGKYLQYISGRFWERPPTKIMSLMMLYHEFFCKYSKE